jgi:ArsR family transcriptional regulator
VRREAGPVSTPLYQLKAEFFKTLGHPVRIRVLELLSVREHAVAEMLPEVGIEPAHLSQQLAVLRRANLVTTRKEGSTVYYSLTSEHVSELLAVARTILSGVLAGQAELLAGLRADTGPEAASPKAAGPEAAAPKGRTRSRRSGARPRA